MAIYHINGFYSGGNCNRSTFSYFGGFGTGETADIEEYAKYAGSVADITILENI